MSSLAEIQEAIEKLTSEERAKLREWFDAQDAEETDELLAAIDEGIRSAETERTFSPISCELRAGARNEVAASNLSSAPASEIFITMSNREIVIDLLSKLPEDTSLEEIAREIELLAGIKTAREQTRRGEGIPAEDARKLVDTWAGQ